MCGVNIAIATPMYKKSRHTIRVLRVNVHAWHWQIWNKPTKGSDQNHRMDACLRSKLLRGGVGKSQKACGKSKFHDEKGKANKESGCRGRTGPLRWGVPANASSLCGVCAGGLSARVGEACGGVAPGEAPVEAVCGESHCA